MSGIQKIYKYDIGIMGAGLSGLSAAIAISEICKDKSIVLVDSKPTIGWEASWGCKSILRKGISELGDFFCESLYRCGGWKKNVTDAPISEIVFHHIVKGRKINLLYYSYPVAVIKEKDNLINSVIFGSKAGYIAVQANIFIDATDSAIILRKCGIDIKSPAKKTLSMRFFMNCIEDSPIFPDTISTDNIAFSVYDSIWKGEAIFECVSENSDMGTMRKSLPTLLNFVRTEIDGFKDGTLTHSSHIAYPEYRCSYSGGIKADKIKNLFCAGAYMHKTLKIPKDIFSAFPLNARILTGESAAIHIAKYIKRIKTTSYKTIPFLPDKLSDKSLSADVLVCGGGTAGALAAIAAARRKVDVTLIEPLNCLGGTATAGAIHAYCAGIEGGLQDEIDQRVNDITPLFTGKYKVAGFSPEAKKLVLQEMVDEADVNVEFATCAIDANTNPLTAQITNVITCSDEGFVTEYFPKVLIDSTGDADVAAMSGAEFTYGRDTDGQLHAYSQPAGFIDTKNDKMHKMVNQDSSWTANINTRICNFKRSTLSMPSSSQCDCRHFLYGQSCTNP